MEASSASGVASAIKVLETASKVTTAISRIFAYNTVTGASSWRTMGTDSEHIQTRLVRKLNLI
jgi:hypothetical protein